MFNVVSSHKTLQVRGLCQPRACNSVIHFEDAIVLLTFIGVQGNEDRF